VLPVQRHAHDAALVHAPEVIGGIGQQVQRLVARHLLEVHAQEHRRKLALDHQLRSPRRDERRIRGGRLHAAVDPQFPHDGRVLRNGRTAGESTDHERQKRTHCNAHERTPRRAAASMRWRHPARGATERCAGHAVSSRRRRFDALSMKGLRSNLPARYGSAPQYFAQPPGARPTRSSFGGTPNGARRDGNSPLTLWFPAAA
jgi:hypothetical protein